MPVPKRRHSRSRSRKRRTNWKLSLPSLSQCPNCGEKILPHRVCPYCGYYKGNPVVQIKTKEG